MATVTIDELKKLKKELETNILLNINAFVKATGVEVEDITQETLLQQSFGGPTTYIRQIKVSLTLT